MRVTNSTSHGLTLRCYKRGWGVWIRNVSRSHVEVIEWFKPKHEDHEPEVEE